MSSSKAITEKRDEAPQPLRWQPAQEVAPSLTQDAAPVVSRWVGAIGLALVVLGGVTLLTSAYGRANLIGPFFGSVLAFVGLGGLLFHAANDAELQIRRAYMAFGYLWLALGVILTAIPYHQVYGGLFLPSGLTCLVLGLVFTLAFHRNETDAKTRDAAAYVVGGLGAVGLVVGFLFGNIYPQAFLFPFGALFILLGLVFLWAFVAMRGVADDLGYWAGAGAGAVGLVFFLVALARSALPWLLVKSKLMAPGYVPFLLPHGLVLMVGGLLAVALAFGLCSDRQLVVLTRRELGSMFYSPLAYLMLLGYAALGWWVYASFILRLWTVNALTDQATPRNIPEPIVGGLFLSWMPVICVLMLVPLITMRLFSEERRTGTLEMLFTAPVDEWVVVLSKFCAALIFFLVIWLPWAGYLIDLRAEGGTGYDYMPLLAFGICLLANGAGFVSMGVFFSSLTRNQLIAAVGTFVGMFFLLGAFFVGQFSFIPENVRTGLNYLSFVGQWISALDGKLPVRDVLLYASATVFWLFLTVKVLESRKWR